MEWLIVSGVIGLIIGSFLNVVIARLPTMIKNDWENECKTLLNISTKDTPLRLNLFFPRSHCPFCQHHIRALENIPLLSFIFLKGRCKECHHKISCRYPLVELLTAIVTVGLTYHYGLSTSLIGALLFSWMLIALIMIDIEHHLLPDSITLPLLWLGLIFNLTDTFAPLSRAVVGAVAGYLFLWMVFWIFKIITRKEGFGYGDFKLLAALGAWVGWTSLPLVILLASFTGALYGVSLLVIRRHTFSRPIPFGPFLAVSGWIALLWGDKIVNTYLTFANLS